MTFGDYQASLEADFKRGNATEHTYRGTLKALLESQFPGIVATNEPKRIKAGAPDYVISRGETPLGYIEAKDLGRLDNPTDREKEQFKRYLGSLGNLIYTDYLEFRWFVEGEHRLTARLASVNGKGLRVEPDGAQNLEMLLKGFMGVTAPTIKSPSALARKMAALAQQIRHTILGAFNAEDLTDDRPDPLHDQYQAFREVLLSDLTPSQFADMYAQTITYGMFAARTSPNFTPPFTRYKAAYDIPKTNPFLRTVFRQMVGPELESSVDWIVDDLVNLLAHADIGAILQDFGTRTRTEDPVVHFYETFLAAYDPKMREARGVYYTPEPVVSYIVRSVDHILKKDFGLRDGLADTSKVRVIDPEQRTQKDRKTKDVHRVQILDPATGTATFLHAVIDQIHSTIVGQTGGNKGMWSGYVKNHLLPRLHGFELLMAPYTVAHMKLGLQLAELGYDFDSNERLKIYLTNALEEAHQFPSLPLFGQAIARESQEAGQVKQDAPVMVVLGNPPYSGHSANKGEWIADLLEEYKKDDPLLRKPGQAKWLNDDYVKFIRLAQQKIEQTGYGVLAFVTNHGYIDNLTFRRMRRSLTETFDKIYILNLHGNTNKKERSPDGSKDQNVFDIKQGVSIGVLVKSQKVASKKFVKYADLWGEREVFGTVADSSASNLIGGKYHWLGSNDISSTSWQEVEAFAPNYSFLLRDENLAAEYEAYPKFDEVFNQNGDAAPGIVTTQDEFAISLTKEETANKIERFLNTRDESEARALYRLCSQNQWDYQRAKRELSDGGWQNEITPILHRPFDKRWTVFNKNVAVHRRERVSRHLVNKSNLAIVTTRQTRDDWDALVTENPVTHKVLAAYDINFVFPLYLYPDASNLFDTGARRPNLAPEFITEFAEKVGLEFINDGKGDLEGTFGPEDVFHYIYATFHAPSYRERYAEFLKIDFPRVPLTSSLGLFRTLTAHGETLVALHLMERVGSPISNYPVDGDNVVDKVSFTENEDGKTGRVYLNKTQHFDGVPLTVWNFYVGGYQVCQKWLKDRKGRTLSYDDLRHYSFIVSALFETIGVMGEIDTAIEAAGGWPCE